ncbi:MAG: hypothetical protein B7Z57_14385 [Acidiphilium sp. 37-60-79]|nr:MAG: hypothetical protein B7Z57_14385 [Acidiphilium sp. 37-60-79]OZB37884.1 MAG: hypothetical protein B7X48_15105 [Acidiphilium sp. 34-60-192]
MLPMHGRASLWMSRSHFVAPQNWQDGLVLKRFRDWLVFDCFVMMNSHGAAHYDDNRHVFEIVHSSGGDGDLRNAVDYNDVVGFLVGVHAERPKGLPVRSYADLYDAFQGLDSKTRAAIEWFVSQPPTPRRFDPLFGQYWGLLHMTILIESLIGLPPNCECQSAECQVCGALSRSHHKMSRREWLRQELMRRVEDTTLVEQYVLLIQAGKKVRDPMSHGPHFDRSIRPRMNPGEAVSYDASRAIDEFKNDTDALETLLASLRDLAHALLVDEAFSVKYYRRPSGLKIAMVG